MKIAILGTKGIPNNYGGFEQFAEYLSKGLVQKGHEVTVYNPHYHPYTEARYEGVTIKRVYSPEKYLGSAANFLYDYLCLKDALRQGYDVIYEAGYHSVAVSYILLKIKSLSHPIIITNMDGLEWMRSKWNYFTKLLIKRLEKIVVDNSHYLISDNLGIQQYYRDRFKRESFFLPYGANLMDTFNPEDLRLHNLEPFGYYLIIARLEPENNIELMLDGFLSSKKKNPVCIVGNTNSRYGQFLIKKYKSNHIRFLGAIYNKLVLDSIRHFSQIYFHGHSVGGTNPSLLEAMACQCFIFAHDNQFNKSVLGKSALFFLSIESIKSLLQQESTLRTFHHDNFNQQNRAKILGTYNWDMVISEHENLFKKLTAEGHPAHLADEKVNAEEI